MLPHFKLTEDIENFCMLMNISIEHSYIFKYVCMNSLKYSSKPRIVSFNLDDDPEHLIPEDKVIPYISYVLNDYSLADAFHEAMAVGE